MRFSRFKYDSATAHDNNDLIHSLDITGSYYCPGYKHGYSNMDEPKQVDKGTKKRFFTHYRKHSIDLVDAFKQWGEHPNAFSSCQYIDGKLEEKPAIKYRSIPYMQYMIKHVEESYPELFSFITEITTDHNDICRKIKDLMTYHTPLAIEEPSFQKIITDKIAGECPNLNVTVKTGQIGDNTYISSHVFKAIFDTVESNELEIALSYKPIDKIRTKLLFRDQLVLVQGDNLTIKRFGQALNELILDKNVKKRVRQHAELNERLMTDERIHRLHDHIQYLHESIHGGQPLGRYPTCDLCRLQDINP